MRYPPGDWRGELKTKNSQKDDNYLDGHRLQLNENVQVIIATHSPAIMMKGWLDKATEMHEITKSSE